MITTYISLLQLVENFASEHKEIRRFKADFLEQLQNFGNEGDTYPILYAVPVGSVFNNNTYNEINTYTINFYCVDLINEDRSNINTILNTTNLILNDLHLFFKEAEIPGVELLVASNVNPINNYMLDKTAGWNITLTLEVQSHSICEIPFNNAPIIPTGECDIVYSRWATQEQLQDLQDQINDINNDIDSINIEINDIQDQIDNIQSITDFTYDETNNTLTITDSQGGTFNAIIDTMESLDITNNLNVSTIDQTNSIDFNITPPTPISNEEGRLKWNDVDGTLDLGLKGGNVTLQLGQEQIIRVVNKTGSNLLESQYKVVRVRTQAEGGAQGQRLAVKLAQADTNAHHSGVLGLVTENINNNQEGFITTFGHVRGINTTGSLQGETWLDGDILWLSETVPGGLTNIEPTNHPVQIGYVEYAHINNGKIFVKVEDGVNELNELHDVNLSSVTNDQVLTYENGFWINKTLVVPTSNLNVGVTEIVNGTNGRILFQSGTTLQQSSNLFWDTANNRLAVGSSNPQARLDVRAQGALSTDIAFRIRNNADTANLFEVRGDGSVVYRLNSSNTMLNFQSNGGVSIGFNANTVSSRDVVFGYNAGTNPLYGDQRVAIGQGAYSNLFYGVAIGIGATNQSNGGVAIGYQSTTQGGDMVNPQIAIGMCSKTNAPYAINLSVSYGGSNTNSIPNSLHLNVKYSTNRQQQFFVNGNSNVVLANDVELVTGTHYDASTVNTMTIHNGVAPTTNIANAFQMYSSDRGGVAGKAAAHFRSEDGTVNVIGDLSGFGTSNPQARLDVRAQGALSTDNVFRVRNNTDTTNIFNVVGNGAHFNVAGGSAFSSVFSISRNGTALFLIDEYAMRFNGASYFTNISAYGTSSISVTPQSGGGGSLSISPHSSSIQFNAAGVGPIAPPVPATSSTSVSVFPSVINSVLVTSVKNGNGDVINLAKETTGVTSSTYVNTGGGNAVHDNDTFDGYTIGQIVKVLRNRGLLA